MPTPPACCADGWRKLVAPETTATFVRLAGSLEASDGVRITMLSRGAILSDNTTTQNRWGDYAGIATDPVGTGSHRAHTMPTGINLDCSKCHAGYGSGCLGPNSRP